MLDACFSGIAAPGVPSFALVAIWIGLKSAYIRPRWTSVRSRCGRERHIAREVIVVGTTSTPILRAAAWPALVFVTAYPLVLAHGFGARDVRWCACSIPAIATKSAAAGREAIRIWEAFGVGRISADLRPLLEGSRSLDVIITEHHAGGVRQIGRLHDEGKGEGGDDGKQLHC